MAVLEYIILQAAVSKEKTIAFAALKTVEVLAVTSHGLLVILQTSKTQISKLINLLNAAGSPDCLSAYNPSSSVSKVLDAGMKQSRVFVR